MDIKSCYQCKFCTPKEAQDGCRFCRKQFDRLVKKAEGDQEVLDILVECNKSSCDVACKAFELDEGLEDTIVVV